MEVLRDDDMYGRIRELIRGTVQGTALVMQLESMMGVEGKATRAFVHLVAALEEVGGEAELAAALQQAGVQMTRCKMRALKQLGMCDGARK